MGFKDLKKQSSLGSLTNRLVKEVEKMNNAGGGNVDDRLWKPEVDKIMDVMQPEFEDETPINPFDLWAGANFKLKIVKKDGFWNYDKSEFDSPNPLLEDDDALEAVWKKEFSLTAFTANDQFKTYDELKTRLDYVLGAKAKLQVAQETEYDNYAAQETQKVTEEEVLKKLETSYQESKAVETVNAPSSEEEEDPLSYFAKLAES